ncbi:hypothetical protein L5515_014751 [Caenorhabditis briggsae]|uniref:Uncharacterized protein n=1 Tax=Caenorhabditis briggsae TaxID=6238 RepID=A0AAE9ED19_CAEBR|nr:hypothetical protein L5515_014751 [Caenorhabditis briggsae]
MFSRDYESTVDEEPEPISGERRFSGTWKLISAGDTMRYMKLRRLPQDEFMANLEFTWNGTNLILPPEPEIIADPELTAFTSFKDGVLKTVLLFDDDDQVTIERNSKTAITRIEMNVSDTKKPDESNENPEEDPEKEEKEEENVTPVSEGIVGTWKPTSQTDYPHFFNSEKPGRKSRWLIGQLTYNMKIGQISWELIPSEKLKNTGRETNVPLKKQLEYSDHSETWSFENDDLVIVFKNKLDQRVIKKYYKFILGGKLHIVYHDLQTDVTATRICERVI